MKKSFKTLFSIATLSITGLMVGGIALSSCGSNTNVETPSTPSQPGQGSGGTSGDQNQGGSTGGGSTQEPGGSDTGNSTPSNPEINVPIGPLDQYTGLQKYLYDINEGARVILNKDKESNPNPNTNTPTKIITIM